MDAIHEAGWPIFAVLILGALTLAMAISNAVDPRREKVPLVVGLGVATLMAGIFGTALGVQCSIAALHKVPAENRWIFLIGLRESLHNLVFAVAAIGCASLAASIGAIKVAARRQ